MISPKERNREKMRQASFVPKPKPLFWWDYSHGSPEQMGLNRLQIKNKKKKK
jgi:hypothetical protein